MIRNLAMAITLIILSSCKDKHAANSNDSSNLGDSFIPYIERIDTRLDEIIPKSSKVEIVADGFDWIEGPLWIEGIGLLFSDIPVNKVYQWNEKEGVSTYLSPAGYTGNTQRGGELGSNALLLDQENNLLLCQHGDRRIAKMISILDDPKAEYKTVIDNYMGKRLNSPNDACINKDGVIYFTDPPYGLENRMEDPLKELSFQGVYSYSQDGGSLQLLTDELSRPNGIAFTPDEKILYVANSDPKNAIWMAYDVNTDGSIKDGKVFYDATSFVDKEAGLPDGLKVMSNGIIFATGPGGVWIFDPSGKVLGKIKTGQATSNCAFGNEGKVLYITADMFVMKIDLFS